MNLPAASLRVLTFNILYDQREDAPFDWNSRRDHVAALLRFHAPDIFCLQEPLRHQVQELQALFPDYDCVAVGSEDGRQVGQHLASFYLREKLELLDRGFFSLSEEPQSLGLPAWDAQYPRIAVWLKLKQKKNGKTLAIFNTHFDHHGEEARRQSALLLGRKALEIAADLPMLLCGDFNANPQSSMYAALLAEGFRDCAELAPLRYGPDFTYHRFSLDEHAFDAEQAEIPEPLRRVFRTIDHIFAWRELRVLRHGVLADRFQGNYPSDHMPKLCDVLI